MRYYLALKYGQISSDITAVFCAKIVRVLRFHRNIVDRYCHYFRRLIVKDQEDVVVGNEAELTVQMERKLLRHGIITFTDLVNLNKLPVGEDFTFYGVPLKIKGGDGSPIRAFAIVGSL